MKTAELLKKLSSVDGPSGWEDRVADEIEKILKDGFRTKPGGFVHLAKGRGRIRKKVGIFAHVDEISLIVSREAGDGFFYLDTVGGVDPKVLPSSKVKVYTRDGVVRGVIGIKAPHITPPEKRGKVQDLDEILLDVSMSDWKKVRVGDRVVIDTQPCEMNGKVCGKALDDRAGCAALIKAREYLKKFFSKNDVYFVFSSMEEVGGDGAKTVAYELKLDYAIVVDVTFAERIEGFQRIEMGKGPAIGIGPFLDLEFHRRAVEIAKENGVKYQIEPLPMRTGTDADSIRRAWVGIKTLLVSIPLLHMHTPVEVVSVSDVEETARLIALVAAQI